MDSIPNLIAVSRKEHLGLQKGFLLVSSIFHSFCTNWLYERQLIRRIMEYVGEPVYRYNEEIVFSDKKAPPYYTSQEYYGGRIKVVNPFFAATLVEQHLLPGYSSTTGEFTGVCEYCECDYYNCVCPSTQEVTYL
jgi:hypothetical protein